VIDAASHRHAEHPIEPIFLRRWSLRAMSGDPISQEQLLTLFEAARWAPSTYNEQEWRFLYACRDTPAWATFFGVLSEWNQIWCRQAAVLVTICAHKVFERDGKPNPVHLFDCGAAFENLALQATAMGLLVHGMQGFNFGSARAQLRVPDDYALAAMFAIGQLGDPSSLPTQLRERETPSGRRPIAELLCEGPFSLAGDCHEERCQLSHTCSACCP
jgi:nitroreductase